MSQSLHKASLKLTLCSHIIHKSHGGIADILMLANAENKNCNRRLLSCPLSFQIMINQVMPLVQANDSRANALFQF